MPCVLLLSQTIRRDEVHLYSLILPRYEDGCQIVILQRFQQELRLAARAGARDQGGGQGEGKGSGRGQARPLPYTASLFLALGCVMVIVAADCWENL
ncbi:MAG TPA: hypothetical protein VK140_04745 [Ktedonobacteraceae bacterium]|nr:hypothetical protein [Ktedonobacteraceae bacterium]